MTQLRPLSALIFAVVLLAIWQTVTMQSLVPAVLLPSPASIANRIFTGAGTLLPNAASTSLVAVGGFALALVAGLGLAAAMALSAWLTRLLYPNLLLFQLLPKVALGPLFVVWLGIGVPSRLAFTTVVSVFPVVIGTLAGLRAANPGQIRLCQALRASLWQIFIHIRVPGALPYIFAGARIAATLAFTGAVVGEFISSDSGLGHVIMNAASQSDTALVFASLVVLCILGADLYGLVGLAERFARRRWRSR